MLREFCTGLGWLCTGRVSPVRTGRANQHGSLILHGSHLLQHGSSLVQHRACSFPSSKVGSPNFSQYSDLVIIWKLIDFVIEA